MHEPLNPIFKKAVHDRHRHTLGAMFVHHMNKSPAGALFIIGLENVAEHNFAFTRDKIDYWIEKHREKHGTNPDKFSGPIFKNAKITWGDVNSVLLMGLGELEGGSSLEHVLSENGYLKGRPKLSEPLILYHTLKYYLDHDGYFPGQTSGPVEGMIDEDWGNWRTAQSCNKRGLRGNLTQDQFRVKYGIRFGSLTKPLIVELALNHLKHEGKLPPRDSKHILGKDGQPIDEFGESWNIIYKDCLAGRRGIPKGTYLNDIYIEYGLKMGQLSNEIIIDEIVAHLLSKPDAPEFPNELTGQVNGYAAEKWSGIEAALSKKNRGIAEQSTIPQLIERFILDQADKHKAITGVYPDKNSGPLTDYPEVEWSIIDQALQNKGKGRTHQHNKTLDQLLSQHGRINPPAQSFDAAFVQIV